MVYFFGGSNWIQEMYFIAISNSNKRDAGPGGHSAHVVFVPPHLDVALVSPVGAPAVLHQPVVVVGDRVIAEAHCQHSVVKVRGAAAGLIVDAVIVELEAVIAGVDGDAGWSHAGHSGLQGQLITLVDVNEAVVSGADVSGREQAPGPVLGGVGVALLLTITLLEVNQIIVLASVSMPPVFSMYSKAESINPPSQP